MSVRPLMCDMELDGGGWQLVAWANPSSESYASGRLFSNYSGATTAITPSAPDFASYSGSIHAQMNGIPLDVRMTYRRATQSTLDISSATVRTWTTASSWTGVLQTGSLGLPTNARETVNHNCAGYQYVAENGAQSTLSKGCLIEYTNGETGSWAGCGQASLNSTQGIGWGLCFDNADGASNRGNSNLMIWHQGNPNYHEVYGFSYATSGTTTPPNGAWASNGGAWTWSAWIRPATASP